jgi:hypothetical protein
VADMVAVAVAAAVDAAAIVEIVAATAEIAATAGKALRSLQRSDTVPSGVAFTLPENLSGDSLV